MMNFEEVLKDNPVIGAIRNEDDFETILESELQVVFVLYGNVSNISYICSQLNKKNKITFVNVDMIDGLKGDKHGLEFIKDMAKPYGVISTNGLVLKHANHLGLFTVQRIFIIDSVSIETGLNNARSIKPDAIEILPGIAYKAIEIIKMRVSQPIITGGLINSQKEAVQALASGAIGISTSDRGLWDY